MPLFSDVLNTVCAAAAVDYDRTEDIVMRRRNLANRMTTKENEKEEYCSRRESIFAQRCSRCDRRSHCAGFRWKKRSLCEMRMVEDEQKRGFRHLHDRLSRRLRLPLLWFHGWLDARVPRRRRRRIAQCCCECCLLLHGRRRTWSWIEGGCRRWKLGLVRCWHRRSFRS